MSEHEGHSVHPLAAGIIVVVCAAIFGGIFSLMAKGWTAPVLIITAALVVWGFVTVLLLDKE
ncbi:MAG TPA: hypothetical protein VFL59_17060 [Candidatus Nanopelagicales bacterium]|nr:hypothetical protein [Candidatus Nanopelagicales bacterium]